MTTIQKYLIKSGAAVAIAGLFAFVNQTDVSAQYSASNWEARTVNEIADEIEAQIEEQDEDGTIEYTFQWGDTLWGISEATDISVDKLVEVNDIDDRSLIQVDTTIYLSADGSVISVQNDDEIVSYDISEDEVEETETPEEVEEAAQSEEEAAEEAQEAEQAEQAEQEVEAAEQEASTSSSEEQAVEEAAPAESTETPGSLIGTFQATSYAVGDGYTPNTFTRDGTEVGHTIYGPDGHRIIAVDPNVIPLGTVVRVVLPSGEEFTATARDTGSAINGNIIDILMSSPQEARNFGRQNGIQVYRLN